MATESLSLERVLFKKVSSHKRKLHRKFQNRLLRLDLTRREYILRIVALLYQIIHKKNCYTLWKQIDSILDELDSETGGLVSYADYIPEPIQREDRNMLHIDFIGLPKAQAKTIISITETLVIYNELERFDNHWDVIEDEFEVAVKRLRMI